MKYKLPTNVQKYISYSTYASMYLAIFIFSYLFVLNNTLPEFILWPLLITVIIIQSLGVYEHIERTLLI